jgi:hypothetical protein
MTSKRPTPPPPIQIALPKSGKTKRCIENLSIEGLLRAVLNPLAGVFHVLSEAVGCMAAQASDGHERDKSQQNKNTFQ